MKLYYSSTSPYVRKVSVTAIECEIDHRIERTLINLMEPSAEFLRDSPLSKVPALVTDDGLILYDSPVICEYLDSLHAGLRLFPPAGPERWSALRQQALADGVCDAAVLCVLETVRRPENFRWPQWIERQWSKVERGLDALEAEVASFAGAPLTIGQIAIGCALGFLDFRCPDQPWRPGRPMLDAFFETLEQRSSMAETRPVDPPPQ